jgi:RNA polymerase sigma factor (sigma-70 family)
MASPKREAVLEKLRVRLLRLASSIGVRQELVEDLVQQVFVVLQQDRYRDLESEDDLVPLACKILYTLRKGVWRKDSRETQVDPEQEHAAPEVDPIRKEIQRRMLETIKTLGPSCRELLLLQLDGYTYDEIGDALHIDKNNAYVRVHRCIATLREKMGVKRAGK